MNRITYVVGTIGLLLGLWLQPGTVASARAIPTTSPGLSIPDNIPAQPNSTVVVPVHFSPEGNAISSLVFSLNFDQTWLTFDPTDSDGDGVPDAVDFNLPPAFTGSVVYDPNDLDGELDFFFGDIFPPLASLPEGDIVLITFGIDNPPVATTAFINFANNPPASFGNTSGQSVPGTTDNGSVRIEGCCDFNNDGQVTVIDIQMVAFCWRQPIGGSCQSRYDIDRDGNLDIVDIQRVAGVITS